MPVTTLTLHHILPYLPFGLHFADPDRGNMLYKSYGFHGETIEDLMILNVMGEKTFYVKDLKPLLYSLDECFDLASPFIMNNTDWDITIAEEVSDFANYKKSLLQCSYATIQAMAEAHIDFHRLIDDGLAVKKEPLK